MILPDPIFPENALISKVSPHKINVIVGAGPAGLMAAEALASQNHPVAVYDAMPSVGRKLLMAGRGGLNLTHSEPFEAFVERFGASASDLKPMLEAFGPPQVRQWCQGLGIETFMGSSGRVFPHDFKAAPLLRAWLARLRSQGVSFHMRHYWTGWDQSGDLTFQTATGLVTVSALSTILALGGGSWPKLGSDGLWPPVLDKHGIACRPLEPSNCGFDADWSAHLSSRFAGTPLKSVVIHHQNRDAKGDLMITETGLEGGPLYALTAPIRDAIKQEGSTVVSLDLCPDRTLERLTQNIASPRGSRSLSSHLKRCAALPPQALALLHEHCGTTLPQSPQALSALIKALPVTLKRPRPLSEAISSAGGVRWDQVDASLQIKSRPGLFVAGEMLDWEAPTGGYLLTACFASGLKAGLGAADYAASGLVPNL